MAKINSISGSPMCGNPITASVTSTYIDVGDEDTLSFHRLIVEVVAGITGGNFKTYTFSTSVTDDKTTKTGETVPVDISSALRAAFSEYDYTPYPTDPNSYPRAQFSITAYDEYRLNSETHTGTNKATSGTYYALYGKFSDMERLLAGESKSVTKLTRKPSTSPQIVCVGETFAYTPATSGNLQSLTAPTSKVTSVTLEGSQYIGGVSVYALPASALTDDRYEFRFINGLGVLESFSCMAMAEVETEITQNNYSLTTQETFGTFSRGIVRKSNDNETLKLTSGPLDRAWADWFTHEFLMAEHVWIYVRKAQKWVRCHLLPDDTVKGINRQSADLLTIDFSCKLDITGSINSALVV